MDLGEVLAYLKKEWAVVRNAPLAMAAFAALGFLGATWFYSERFTVLGERIQVKADLIEWYEKRFDIPKEIAEKVKDSDLRRDVITRRVELSGREVIVRDILPTKTYIIGVFIEVVKEIHGAKSFSLGYVHGVERSDVFGRNLPVAAGTTTGFGDGSSTSPWVNSALRDVFVAADDGGTFTDGAIDLKVVYETMHHGQARPD